jgi:hypothetical protein
VPLVRPSPSATADIEAVSVAPTQPEGDVSSARGRAGTPVAQVARSESWMPGPRVTRMESWTPRGVRPKAMKQAMQEPRRVGRSDRLGWRSDHRPPTSVPGVV